MDLKKICRTCLRIPIKSVDLFKDNELLQKINAIASIKLESNEELSQTICEECVKNINHSFKFRKLIRNTNNDLQSRLETLKETNYTCKARSDTDNKSIGFVNVNDISEPENDKNEQNGSISIENNINGDMNNEDQSEKECMHKCGQCDKMFDTKKKLYCHVSYHHSLLGTSKSACNICGKEMIAYNLKAHMKLHSQNPCRCKECGNILKNSVSLASHMRNHRKNKLQIKKASHKCEECGNIFNSNVKLQCHYRQTGHGETKIECNICGTKIRRCHLPNHVKLHSEPPRNCKVCGKLLKNSDTLAWHMRTHLNKKRLITKCICKCDKCNRIFDTKQKLQSHVYFNHGGGNSTVLCSICGKQMSIRIIKAHIKTHTEGACRCQECGKVLKNSGSLAIHMRIHSNKEFNCEVCGKIFNVKAYHTEHVRVHHTDQEDRKATCHICGQKIVRKAMKRHMRKHTGERRHVCSYCNKGLTSSNALKVHMRIHTNEKPYLCEYCSLSFPQRVSLRTHLKKEHGILLIGDKYSKC